MGKTNARLRHLVLGLAVAAATVLVGCAPQANDVAGGGGTGQDEPAAVDFSWSQEADCAMCHAAESASMEDASCQAAMHEQQGVPCSGCHADEARLATVHEGATTASSAPARLKSTSIDESTCTSCHGDRAALAVETAESAALVDSQGTTANPHELPSSPDHDGIACSDCHQMHVAGAAGELAKKTCIACHHEDVFECGTCHEEQ